MSQMGRSWTSTRRCLNDLADKDFSHYMNVVCRLDRDGTLDEAPQNKEAEGCHWSYSVTN